ncbi:hypothetical protein SUBVAR_06292 [Subdoligranulum variabile DSM 15176]|uniref:Uncharacterized protein n=1 Tax=Subdoligranulum variabile DSM 15176 TaxID=411471 RepID=D1PPH7_9FIRM|nr:hypothetical protein SUBVAR_06292 [Subdoligranulum variabile DSM 15176]
MERLVRSTVPKRFFVKDFLARGRIPERPAGHPGRASTCRGVGSVRYTSGKTFCFSPSF